MVDKAPGKGQKVTLGKDAPVKEEETGHLAGDSLAAKSVREDGDFTENPHAKEKVDEAESGGGKGPASASSSSRPSHPETKAPEAKGPEHKTPESKGPETTSRDKPSTTSTSASYADKLKEAPTETSGGSGARRANPEEKEPTTSSSSEGPGYDNPEQGARAPTYATATRARELGGPHGRGIKEDRDLEGAGPGDSILAEPGSRDDPARLALDDGQGQERSGGGGGGGEGRLGAGDQPFGALESEKSA